jgi:peroxiredoxin family protein
LQQIEKQQLKRGEIKVVKMKMMKINKKVMKWNAKTMNTNANASICSHNENTSYKG